MFIQHHEDNLLVTAEKLRGDFARFATYVGKAGKRLRDLMQLKAAADYKLCNDVKKFDRCEVAAWQMGFLPTETHLCECVKC